MNKNIQVTELSVKQAKELYKSDCFIDDDILLIENFHEVPLPPGNGRMNCLFLALCTNGKASYTVDTKDRTVGIDDVIIISEGQILSDYLLSRDCSGVVIMISYDFFRDIVSDVHEISQLFIFSRTNPVFHLEEKDAEVIKEHFFLIKRKVDEKEHHFRKQLVKTLMKALIYEISNTIYHRQFISTVKKTRAETIFTKFIKLVEQNFRTQRRVGWYAGQLYITPKYLSESVKAVSKRRPNDWIDNYVTMEIRVMLKNTTMSIKEIAQQLHFANQSFLGKYFKEHVGMSPKEYRRS